MPPKPPPPPSNFVPNVLAVGYLAVVAVLTVCKVDGFDAPRLAVAAALVILIVLTVAAALPRRWR